MPDSDFAKLQRTFKRVNPHVLRLFRAHLGWCMSALPPLTGKIMVITHTGRKSGLRRQTPANYAVIAREVWCTTNAHAQWLHNIQADPRVEVWLPLRRPRHGVAEDLPLDAAHVDQFRAVLKASGFAAPLLAGLHPRRATDSELLDAGRDYRLLRVRLGDRVTRAHGSR